MSERTVEIIVVMQSQQNQCEIRTLIALRGVERSRLHLFFHKTHVLCLQDAFVYWRAIFFRNCLLGRDDNIMQTKNLQNVKTNYVRCFVTLFFCVCHDLTGKDVVLFKEHKGLVFCVKWNDKSSYLVTSAIDQVCFVTR